MQNQENNAGLVTGSNNQELVGHGLHAKGTEVYWYTYAQKGLDKLFALCLQESSLDKRVAIIKTGYVWDGSIESTKLLSWTIVQIIEDQGQSVTLLPINLYRKHWAGLVIEKGGENDNTIKIVYLDSSSPSLELRLRLTRELAKLCPEYQIKFEIMPVEEQKFNNCGPELIENFMLYLTGSRYSQEEAVKVYSQLYEQYLLEDKSVALVEESSIEESSTKYPTLYLGYEWIENKITNAISSTVSDALELAVSTATKIEELVQMCIPGEQPDWNIAQMLFYTDLLNFALESGGMSVPFSRRPNSDPNPDDFGGYEGGDSSNPQNNEAGLMGNAQGNATNAFNSTI